MLAGHLEGAHARPQQRLRGRGPAPGGQARRRGPDGHRVQRLPHVRLLLRHVHRQLDELPGRGDRHGAARQRHHPGRLQRAHPLRQGQRREGHAGARRRPASRATSSREAAVGNALAADASLGCSTNTVLHLAAIATEAGLDFDLRRINEVAAKVPHICKIAPAGTHHMEDLYHAGGIQAVMNRLHRRRPHGRRPRSASPAAPSARRSRGARVLDDDRHPAASTTRGTPPAAWPCSSATSPRPAPWSRRAPSPTRCCVHSGPARVFESEADAVAAIAARDIADGSVVVIRDEGPKGAPGMPEMLSADVHARRPGPGQGRGAHHRRPLQRRHARRRHRPRRARGARRRPHRRSCATATSSASTSPPARSRSSVSGGGGRAAARRLAASAARRRNRLSRPLRQTRLRRGEGSCAAMTPDKKMKGSQALVAALEHEGCEVLFGYPGRRRHPVLRRALRRQEAAPRPRAPRAGRGARRRRLRPRHRQGGRLHRHQRPRRHQPGHRHRHRLPGLVAAGRHHLAGAQRPHRHGRLPGGRHHRHHAADRQALATWSRTRPSCRGSSTRRSTSPPPAGPGRCVIDIPVDVALGEVAYRDADTLDLPGYKPTFKGHIKQIRAAAKAINEAAAAGALPGRRRDRLRRRARDPASSPSCAGCRWRPR